MQLPPVLSALLRSKTGAIVVAAQVALTLAIVCNALFVVSARLAMADRPSGVAGEHDVFQIQFAPAGQVPDPGAMVQRDLETLRAIPGVVAAAFVNSMPLSTSGSTYGVTADPTRSDRGVGAAAYFSGESLMRPLGLELASGRDFEPGEVRELDATRERARADVVIITQHLAHHVWPDERSVIGKTLYLGDGADAQAMRVVGVVRTLISSSGEPDADAYDAFILPVRYLRGGGHYAVRAAPGQTPRVMRDADRALSSLRRDRVRINLRTVAEMRARRYRAERSGATLLIAVTIGLLLVTASGIVGVSSLWVGQRRKQIGIRRALGARRRDILMYFVGENLLITTAGVIAGVGCAIALNQYLIEKVEMARLPIAYVIGGVLAAWLLGVVSVLGPAWRASSVPPATATRSA